MFHQLSNRLVRKHLANAVKGLAVKLKRLKHDIFLYEKGSWRHSAGSNVDLLPGRRELYPLATNHPEKGRSWRDPGMIKNRVTLRHAGRVMRQMPTASAFSMSCLCQNSMPSACSELYPYFSLANCTYSSTAIENDRIRMWKASASCKPGGRTFCIGEGRAWLPYQKGSIDQQLGTSFYRETRKKIGSLCMPMDSTSQGCLVALARLLSKGMKSGGDTW